jgi:ABC-type multidrug transport system fused ATPase/permease subunit
MNTETEKPQSKLAAHYSTSRTKDEHLTIEWEDLEYSVITKDSKKSSFMKSVTKNNYILKNVAGRAESGQLLAIMGPTGAYCDVSSCLMSTQSTSYLGNFPQLIIKT